LLYDEETDSDHCIVIKDFDSFVRYTTGVQNQFYCRSCMNPQSNKLAREFHERECLGFINQNLVFPESKSLTVSNAIYNYKHPYFMVADFECFMNKQVSEEEKTKLSHTKIESKHDVGSYGWALVGPQGIMNHKFYTGNDSGENFLNDAIKIANHHMPSIQSPEKMFWTDDDSCKSFVEDNLCVICGLRLYDDVFLSEDTNYSVLHHDHTGCGASETGGKLLGKAHRNCNLKSKIRNELPIFFHHFGRYDSKILIQSLSKSCAKKQKVLAKSSEDILCLNINYNIRIMDSYKHLPHSLQSLVGALKLDEFKVSRQVFQKYKKLFPLLIRNNLCAMST